MKRQTFSVALIIVTTGLLSSLAMAPIRSQPTPQPESPLPTSISWKPEAPAYPARNRQAVEDGEEGLVLWLKAETAGKRLQGQSLPTAMERWIDQSPAKRPFQQPDANSRPQIVKVADQYVVRFDGEDDFFRWQSDADQTTQAMTVFVVGAPHRNAGDFRGFLASNRQGGRDYETGFNVDLGPGPSLKWNQINVEGAGFGGAVDLMEPELEFGQLAIMQITIDPQGEQVSVTIDGKPAGQRPYDPTSISLQEWTVGGRYYTNGPGSQQPRSPFAGDLVEIRAYDRVLPEGQAKTIGDQLAEKYQSLRQELPAQWESSRKGIVLQKVAQPPAIQMMIPGFEVDEIPVQLTNQNNVRYRSDGTLVSLGYNGDIHLLRDTDGDGLEDQETLFWKNNGSLSGPVGMALTPKGYPKGQGVFVPSKGKISLIVDTNGDDRADQEIVVATGWPEIFTTVDAVGICLDDQNNIYFGLGVADFSNAYQVGDSGTAQYDRSGENGTIQKVSADFSKRETVCTGIRFPVSMAFNQHGDLFCTEQEGATWLPNGNPLDELLWIRPERHYGFPPRHPQYNPGVIDEPSVTEFPPQHQSTCGMFFNRSVNGGPVFGDEAWKEDALICGESRGKIWRTTLHKSANGYLAQKQLIACLQMLTLDACVSPRGDLVVCCHSGPPDWGTGPTGAGKLYRIRPRKEESRLPRPVLAWQQSPSEIRVTFDQPIDPLWLQESQGRATLDYGTYVQPGDTFENLVPPYVAVHRQLETPRFRAEVQSLGLTPDRHTLLIQSSPINAPGGIAFTLPWDSQSVGDRTSQPPELLLTETDVRNTGVIASWESQPSHSDPSIWLPHPNLAASQSFTKTSLPHQSWFPELQQSGILTLKTQLDLFHMLRPAVQPGETIDYKWPPEEVTLTFRSSVPFQVKWDQQVIASSNIDDGHVLQHTAEADREEWLPLQIQLEVAGPGLPPEFDVSFHTNEDPRQRVIALERWHLPWIDRSNDRDLVIERTLPAELDGGSWGRGRQVFHSAQAACYKCHQLDHTGGLIGPDLSNLRHRDFVSTQRDVTQPSYSINPDYTGQTLLLTDGRVLTGILRHRDGKLQLGNPEGEWETLDQDQIEQTRPADVSIMPAGLLEKLTPQQRKDLFVYLLASPPSMPLDSPLKAPPVRTREEVAKVLADSQPVDPKPLSIVLVAGPKDHGPGEHDYPAWQRQWAQLLMAASETQVQLAWEFPDDQQMETADVLIFFQKGDWTDQRQQKMDAYFDQGGGAIYLHWAVNGNQRSDDMSRRIGLASRAGSVGYRHGPLDLSLHHTDHPIMRNLGAKLQLYDESYWELTGDPGKIDLLATSVEDGKPRPQIWTYQPGQGRVLVCIPGHYSWTFDDPLFRTLLLRGVAWSARRPVDRFNELVPLGARVSR